MLTSKRTPTSLLLRALSAAASVKRRRSKRLCFLLACHADSAKMLNELVGELRTSLPGCRLICGGIEDAARVDRTARHYDAVFVVLGRGERSLPDQLWRSLVRENWRYHLLAAAPDCCRLRDGAGAAGLVHWQFEDWKHLQIQLGDLIYERARDVQQIPRGAFDLRACC